MHCAFPFQPVAWFDTLTLILFVFKPLFQTLCCLIISSSLSWVLNAVLSQNSVATKWQYTHTHMYTWLDNCWGRCDRSQHTQDDVGRDNGTADCILLTQSPLYWYLLYTSIMTRYYTALIVTFSLSAESLKKSQHAENTQRHATRYSYLQ